MEKAAADARYAELHEKRAYHDGTFPRDLSDWAEKRSAETPYHYLDGVTISVAPVDLAPHDHFLGGWSACEECSGSAAEG